MIHLLKICLRPHVLQKTKSYDSLKIDPSRIFFFNILTFYPRYVYRAIFLMFDVSTYIVVLTVILSLFTLYLRYIDRGVISWNKKSPDRVEDKCFKSVTRLYRSIDNMSYLYLQVIKAVFQAIMNKSNCMKKIVPRNYFTYVV